MSKQTVTCGIPHGIVFIYDPAMIIDVPDDTGSGPVLNTPNCISLWSVHEDDGEVELEITDETNVSYGELRFTGSLIVESGRVAFNDSGVHEIIGINVPQGKVSVRVYSNDPLYPSKLLCVVEKD